MDKQSFIIKRTSACLTRVIVRVKSNLVFVKLTLWVQYNFLTRVLGKKGALFSMTIYYASAFASFWYRCKSRWIKAADWHIKHFCNVSLFCSQRDQVTFEDRLSLLCIPYIALQPIFTCANIRWRSHWRRHVTNYSFAFRYSASTGTPIWIGAPPDYTSMISASSVLSKLKRDAVLFLLVSIYLKYHVCHTTR